jgi:hypothetical protein
MSVVVGSESASLRSSRAVWNYYLHDADPVGLALPLAGFDEIVEDITVVCIDDIPADAGFARPCRNR